MGDPFSFFLESGPFISVFGGALLLSKDTPAGAPDASKRSTILQGEAMAFNENLELQCTQMLAAF